MAGIAVSITSGLHPTAAKTFTDTDANWDRVIAAFQNDANVSVNGTATYPQVCLYIFNTLLINPMVVKVKAADLAAAQAAVVTPAPPNPV